MHVLFKKGRKVAIDGKLTHRYLDAPNGQVQRFSEVIVNEFMLMNG
jgi:single-stranded DNA-binding protein